MQAIAEGCQNDEAKFRRSRRSIIGVGATQVVFGLVCLGLGIGILVYIDQRSLITIGPITLLPYFKYGEGIWGGVLVILAGVFGIFSSTFAKRPCVVNFYLGFSILGAIVSAVTLFVSFAFGMLYLVLDPVAFSYELALALGSLVSLVLCVVAAVLCCCVPPTDMGSACCSCCCNDPDQGYGDRRGVNNPNYPTSQV